jgi:hypothetical protein
MSLPLPWTFTALAWHPFRVPYKAEHVRHKNRTGWRKVPQYPLDIEQWCKDNLQGRWTWGASNGSNVRPYYIEDKPDAMLFKLVWSERVSKPEYREIG